MTNHEIISAKWVEMQAYSKSDVLMSAKLIEKQYRCRHCQHDWSSKLGGPYESDHTTADCPIGQRPSGWRKS